MRYSNGFCTTSLRLNQIQLILSFMEMRSPPLKMMVMGALVKIVLKCTMISNKFVAKLILQ